MDEQQIIRRRKILAILLATSFILIVIVAGVVISLLSNDDFGVNIKNEDSLKSENKDITLDSNDMKALREHIRSISEVPDDEEINVAFREGSYKEYKINGTSESSTQIEVLIDVENTKMTYLASITHGVNNFYGVGLSCTKSDVAKWPETFCVGTNFHSSIDANIANLLPYREIENNELKYTIKHVNNQAKLEVGVEARCNDKKAEDEAIEKAKSLLTKYGISKDQIPVQVDHGVCKAYEDYVDSNGHGNQHLSQ